MIDSALPQRGRFAHLKPVRGYFDRPNGAGENFQVGGWMLAPFFNEFNTFALYLDQELAGVVEAQTAPQSYDRVRTWGEPKLFQFLLSKRTAEIPKFSRVEVLGCVGGQPVSRLTTMFRGDLETNVPTPPEKLMYRVTGNTQSTLVKSAGLRCASDFLDAISQHNELSSARSLLDWGCGCGRVTVHLMDFFAESDLNICGCDIDGEAIAWCNENIRRGCFVQINPFPPLPWPDNSFDVVVSCSVFTHLSEEVQQLWLGETRRVIAPGGLFLASINSTFSDSRISRQGISDDTPDSMLDGIAPPGYYRGTVQSRDYTINRWSSHFDILDFIENGIEGTQDLVVMRKPKHWPGAAPNPFGLNLNDGK